MVSSPSPSSTQREWIQEQETLKENLSTEDDFSWTIPYLISSSSSTSLRYVGGVDVSASRDDPCLACATLVVIDLQRDLDVVYEAFDVVRLQVPYVPGFLAFREAPVLVKLLEDMKSNEHALFPQLLMVDGNGILHPRGFGLACHLGILTNLPAIGIGKNLHHVDGLTMSKARELLEDGEKCGKNSIELVGGSGQIWGVAMRSGPHSSKPIFVSVGHRISLNSCLEAVKLCCKFRVPEPVRQADIRSRRWLVTHGGITKT